MQGYDGGLPVAAVEGGVEFLVPPWLVMKAGDLLEVFWGDLQMPVWSKDIEPEDENELIKGVIDEGHIRRGEAYPVFYRVTRPFQEPESTPPERFFVKLDRPGGFDDDQSTPGNQNLRYHIPQSIIDGGVGPEEAAAGVPITILPYLFMRINDLVKVAWGSVEKTVLAANHGEIFEDRRGGRYPQSGLILPAHRAGRGVKRIEEEVLRSDQHGVSRHRGRGVDAVSRCSAPYRFAR